MRIKPRVSYFLKRSAPFWRGGGEGVSEYPASDSLSPLEKDPIQEEWGNAWRLCLSLTPLTSSPQAWTRAKWLMKASTGTPQTAASAAVIVGEPCWAAPSCHAVA